MEDTRMKCKRCCKTPEEHEAGRDTDYCIADVVMELKVLKDSSEGILLPIDAQVKYYSTQIADADEILKNWESEDRMYYLRWNSRKYIVEISKPNELFPAYSAEGSTKELATCRAALMASEEE